MNKIKAFLLALFSTLLIACGASADDEQIQDNAVVIDVRTPQEWQTGHLADATLLPVSEFAQGIEALVSDKDQQVVLYCRSGNRAGQMQTLMTKLGYTNVINAGGVNSAASLLDQQVVTGN